jgi:hypothetical protein
MKKIFKAVGKAAGKGANAAKNAANNPMVKQALQTAVENANPDVVRKLAERTVGKETTDKIVKTGEDAYNKADKTLGEGRLEHGFKSGRSAFLAALALPGPSKAVILHATIAGAAVGFATRKDVVGDVSKTLFGVNDDEAPKGPTPPQVEEKKPEAPEVPKAQEEKPAKPARKPRTPKGPK